MINIAILGYGYWGCNLVRNFYKFSNCKISYIVLGLKTFVRF